MTGNRERTELAERLEADACIDNEEREKYTAEEEEYYLECEKRWVFLMLISVAGFYGVFTFLMRGGVFCNAQTGNFVFLAIAIGTFQWKKGFGNNTPARKKDSHNQMGYPACAFGNGGGCDTGLYTGNSALSDISDNHKLYMRNAVQYIPAGSGNTYGDYFLHKSCQTDRDYHSKGFK